MLHLRSIICAAIAIASLQGCAVFDRLTDDLALFERSNREYCGAVRTIGVSSDSIIVIALAEADGAKPVAYRLMPGPGNFDFLAKEKSMRFVAFDDADEDLVFDHDEAWGESQIANGTKIDGCAPDKLVINVHGADADSRVPPAELINYPLHGVAGDQGFHYNIGTITPIGSPLFSSEQAAKGNWTPYQFMMDGGAGIHFQDEYDPDRIPVLFVHGINGSPQDFINLINSLDTSRYQPWYVSYPTGARLDYVSKGLFDVLETLHRKHRFRDIHIVAHSMGGLVTRASLNFCLDQNSCEYVRSFTSISTPWGGVAMAQAGVKHAPAVVPSWRDLDPTSEFLNTLLVEPLPDDLPFYLLFGFYRDSFVMFESGDGVIGLSSQLRPEAQQQAQQMRGFNANHAGILKSAECITAVHEILRLNSR